MKYLELSDVRTYNRSESTRGVSDVLTSINSRQKMRNAIFSRTQAEKSYGDLSTAIVQGIDRDPLSSPENQSSGAYFANENVIGGSSTEAGVRGLLGEVYRRESDPAFSGRLDGKLKIGPGIGFVRPPNCYLGLASEGLRDPNLILNYNAPGGTIKTRTGIKRIIDASIEHGADILPADGCFVTEGATEGLQLALQAYQELTGGGGEVVFLGPGYYAGPLAAQRLGLPFSRVMSEQTTAETGLLPDPSQLQSMEQGRKMVVATTPNNPDGSDYSEADWANVLSTIRTNPDAFLLLDNIFGGLRFDGSTRDSCLRTAQKMGILDRVLTTSSLSKTVNFAGDRVGWIATTNSLFAQKLNEIIVDRRCNPRLTVEPILDFEGKARQVQALMREDSSIANPINALKILRLATDQTQNEKFGRMYTGWLEWQRETKRYYQDNLGIVEKVLGDSGVLAESSPNKAGFNTFVRLNVPLGTNSMDFLTQLMLTTGTYTQIGPCFGGSQKEWDARRGWWLRISYACDRDDLKAGLERIAAFTRFYSGKSTSLVFPFSYDKQI